ncbi:Cytochrome P450 [Akanthomyces lecanii RCEF 1005]|uniref:Cytochrome P450 n=1 Tax=Akanthomyces lecanii RCEF 1005 TaxID=1081108 RepID=A0A168AWH6_CORDF|nr:Cytochrome P450 [Akanthomyces lecanii RCEF 1005]
MEIFEVFQPLPELLVQLPHRFYQLSWPELSILSLLRPLIACIAIYLAIFLKSSSTASFPGPRPWPIVGNLPSLYRCHAERQFFLWSKQLGDVIQVRFGNMTVIVVNSAASAKEIFTGSAAALSSRPIFHTFHQFIAGTLGPTIGTAVYGDALKRGRKATAAELSKPAVKANLDKIDLETRHFIHELLSYGSEGLAPLHVSKLVKRLALSLSMSICYGRRMYLGDPLTQEIIEVEHEILKLRSMTDNLQDFVPMLRVWPFNRYRGSAVKLCERRDAYVRQLNEEVEAKMLNNTHEQCLWAKNEQAAHPLPLTELSTVLLTFLSGGLATESNTIYWGLILLATRPDIQQTALDHIQRAYPDVEQAFEGTVRDTEDIPYISALVREILRFYTPSRLALPRLAVQSIAYKDKIIPEGSTVVLNTFACNRDPTLYRDPDVFRPERWFEDPDQPIFSYGLGYRMCAGYTLANHVMYTLFTRLIASFEICAGPGIDADPISGCEDPAHQAMAPRPTGLYFKPRDATLLKSALARDIYHQI